LFLPASKYFPHLCPSISLPPSLFLLGLKKGANKEGGNEDGRERIH
jgi:hypothetical protein